LVKLNTINRESRVLHDVYSAILEPEEQQHANRFQSISPCYNRELYSEI